MEANKLINDLSVAEKIELYNCLYEDLSGKGIDGDTELAHVNVEEMAVLRAMGGSGTINPHTNLIQFGGGGSAPPPPPTTQTVTQQATIPEELKPFVTDVLEKSKAIQERREVEGYVPFSGPRIAEFSPEQTQAFESIKGLVGQGQQYFDPAARLTAASAFAPTAPQVSQFMNPYLQNVVDIQQREARRAADVERQQLGAQAVGAGGFGGSRQAILEAEQARNLQQQLGDIQARGLAGAYEDAQARLQQQRERERLAGAQFATLGQVAPGQAFRELSALEAIGAQRQQQQQQALDIAQQEYEIARTFPERTLQDYQSIIRGYAAPIPASTVQRSQTTTPAPSFLQQATGLGIAAAGAGKAFGAFKEGGLVSLSKGSLLKDGGSTQIDMLSQMSTQELNKAAGDPDFSIALVEAERRRRRDAVDETNRRSRTGIFGTIPRNENKIRANELTGLLTPEQIYNRGLDNFPATSDKNLVAKRQAALAAMERGDYKTLMSLSQQHTPTKSLVELLEEKGKPTTGVPNIEAAINALGQLVPEGLKPRPYGQGVEDYGPRLQTEIERVQKAAVEKQKDIKKQDATPAAPTPAAPTPASAPEVKPAPAVKPAAPTPTPAPINIGEGLPDMADREVGSDTSEAVRLIAEARGAGDKTQSETGQNLVKAFEYVNPFRDKFSEAQAKLGEITQKEREELQKQTKSIDQDKWMQLANFGFSILAQPGGQTLLEVVGKGAKESQLVGNLSKLNDKQRALVLNASQLDRRELQDKLGLTKTQADMYYKSRDLELKSKTLDNEAQKLDIMAANATSSSVLNQIKARKALLDEQRFQLDLRTKLSTTFKLGKDDIKAAKKEQSSFFKNEGAVLNFLSDSTKSNLTEKGYVGEEAVTAMKKLPTSVFINIFNTHQRSKEKGDLGVFYNALAKQLPTNPK